jgi:hypothetical protein
MLHPKAGLPLKVKRKPLELQTKYTTTVSTNAKRK